MIDVARKVSGFLFSNKRAERFEEFWTEEFCNTQELISTTLNCVQFCFYLFCFCYLFIYFSFSLRIQEAIIG